MYGIFANSYPKNGPNVGKYSSTMEHLGLEISRVFWVLRGCYDGLCHWHPPGSAGFIFCPQKNHGVLPDKMQAGLGSASWSARIRSDHVQSRVISVRNNMKQSLSFSWWVAKLVIRCDQQNWDSKSREMYNQLYKLYIVISTNYYNVQTINGQM